MTSEILNKAEYFDRVIQERHATHGLVLPALVLPPYGGEDYQTGNFENCAIWTGEYIAAQALRYAVTGQQEAKELARYGVSALHKLQDITGHEGLIARGFKAGDEPTWDEDFFWKKRGDRTRQGNEWHQADGYRWLGDASKSQVFGVTFGYFAYNQFCKPSEEERQEIGRYFSRIVDRIIGSAGRILDSDGQVSGYGNYFPRQYLGVGGIGPLLMLAKLKLAGRLTGEYRFEQEYQRLLDKGYVRFLERCRVNPPVLRQLSTSFGSEDNLAMLNYYMLINLEDNDRVLESCRRGLEKRWGVINDPENSLFNFLYHSTTQKETPDLKTGIDALRRFSRDKTVPSVALKRKLPDSRLRVAKNLFAARMPIESRPIDEYAWRVNPLRRDEWVGEEGTMEFTGVDFLIATYLGIHQGIF